MKRFCAALFALLLSLPAPAAEPYSQAELEQMLAPVALYPDALLSQVLMASTYPLDVVEAARWSRAHAGLQGDEAVAQVAAEDWDPSVKSLVAFPTLLQRMDEQLERTRRLGDAFLEQEAQVMQAVQRLRQRAQAAGQLPPDERLRVVADGDTIVIEQADPRVVYVPYYDPWVVYGGWGWPAYPPYAWSPWSPFVVGVTAGFFFGAIDWHHHHVKVAHVHSHYLRPRHAAHAYRPVHVGKWQHAPRYKTQQRAYSRRHDERPGRLVQPHRSMPPALSASPPPRAARSQPHIRPARTVPYDRGHGSTPRAVDRADRVGRVRADAAQHRPARSNGVAGNARRDAGAVSVRPSIRAGMAGDRPRMAR
jgi:hypothetical protein